MYCAACYKGLKRSTCSKCGLGIRYTSVAAPDLCRKCNASRGWKNLACSRCGSIAKEKGKLFEGKVFCQQCSHYAAPTRKCSYCSNESVFVRNSHSCGLTEPACPTCISRHTPTCGVCREKRQIVGDVEGRPACRACVARGTLLDGICNRCGLISPAANCRLCPSCRNMDYAVAMRTKGAASLCKDWVKDIFLGFCEHAGILANPKNAATLIRRNVGGFQQIDSTIDRLEDLTTCSVLDALSDERGVTRFPAVRYYLSAAFGLDFSSQEAVDHLTLRKIQRVKNEPESVWIRAELEGFFEQLMRDRERFLSAGIKRSNVPIQFCSILSCVTQARLMLDSCESEGASSSLAISQGMLDSHVAHRAKSFHTLGRFIRYLNGNRRRFSRLKLPDRRGKRSSVHNRISAERRAEMVSAWLAASEPKDLRNSAAALLCMFYLQKPLTVLSLRMESVERKGTNVYVNFGLGPEEIDPEIASVLVRWLDVWHHHSRFKALVRPDFLFPGIRPDCGYTVQSFSIWLRTQHGITCSQLFSTAVHGLIEAGLNDPGALVYQLGLKPDTAIRYWKDSGRDISSFLYAESIQAMRDSGDLSFE